MSENNNPPTDDVLAEDQIVPELLVPSLPFVGREEIIEKTRHRLLETRNNQGGGLAFIGKSGVGKTRIAKETLSIASEMGMTGVLIACRGTIHRPYQPVIDLVRTILGITSHYTRRDQQGQLTNALEHLGLTELFSTFTELLNLKEKQKGNTLTGTLISHSKEFTLPNALTHLLRSFSSRGHSALLIFDDIDQAHPISQGILITLAQSLLKQSVLVLATFSPDAPLFIKDAFGTSSMVLANFSRAEMVEFSTSVPGYESLISSSIDRFWVHTKGLPLFSALLLEDLLQEWHDDADEDAPSVELASLEELVVKHFEALPAEQQLTLKHASILGNGFRIGALGTMRGEPYTDSIYHDLSSLYDRGWLGRTGKERLAAYHFNYRLLQEIIYDQIDEAVQKQLHLRAGDYYAVPSTSRKLRVDNAIYHYLLVGDARRAIAVTEMAQAQARQSEDSSRLITLYKRGAEIAGMDATLIDKQAMMAEKLGDSYVLIEDYRQAARAYTEYAPTTAPLTLLSKLGLVLLTIDTERSAKILSQIVPAIPRHAPKDLYWRTEAGLIWALAASNQLYEAIRHSRDILSSLGETAGFGSERTLIRATLGMALFYFDDPEEAHPHLESARAGWGARGNQEGIMLINQILIEMPKETIIKRWLKIVMTPMVEVEKPFQ